MFLWRNLQFSVILDAGKRRLARIANPGRGGRLCPPGRNAIDLRVYLKTPNAPGQQTFSRCAAPFFLEIRQYSCEKMSCSAQKFLAAGHIGSFQIHPTKIPGESVCTHAYPVGADAGHSRSRRRSVTDVGLPLAGTHRPLQPNAQVHTDSPWIFEKSTAFGGRTEASAPTNTLNISHKKTERNANYDL